MNKTIQINLGGFPLTIDENAFLRLESYLHDIRAHLDKEEVDEIIQDIEYRIAELIQAKLNKTSKIIVSLEIIEEIILKIGNPQKISGMESSSSSFESKEQINDTQKKKLFRYPKDKIISGVCSGLSIYLGLHDPIWIRILMILLVFFSGGSILIGYLIAMAIIPEAKTPSDLMQLKGKAFNLSSLENNFDRLRDELNSPNTFKTTNHIIEIFLKVVVYFIAGFLLLIGSGIIIALVWILIMTLFGSFYTNIFDFIFTNSMIKPILIVGIGLALLIPALMIIFSGLQLIFQKNLTPRYFNITALALWIIGLIMIGFVFTHTKQEFQEKAKIEENINLSNLKNKKITLLAQNDIAFDEDYHIEIGSQDFIFDERFIPFINVKIEKSDDSLYMIRKQSSNGATKKEAQKFAAQIEHQFQITDSSLFFPKTFELLNKPKKFRNQQISYTLYLPIGYSIYLDKSIADLLDDLTIDPNHTDQEWEGHIWTMTKNGLVCDDCKKRDDKDSAKNAKGKIILDDEEYEIQVKKKTK